MDGDRNKIKSDKYNWLATQCLLFWLLYHLKMKVKKTKEKLLKSRKKMSRDKQKMECCFFKRQDK